MPFTFQNYRFRKYYQNLTPLFRSAQFQGYAMVAMSLFTISFFGIFAIKPTLNTITALNRQIADKNDLNQKLDQKINSLILAQEEFQKIQNDLSFIYGLMPGDPQFPLLFRKLELVASQNNAAITNISFGSIVLYKQDKTQTPPNETSNPEQTMNPANKTQIPANKPVTTAIKPTSALSYSLGFSGEYKSLLSLLNQLTKLDRLVTIESVQLTGSSDNEKSKLDISLSTSSYYLALSL